MDTHHVLQGKKKAELCESTICKIKMCIFVRHYATCSPKGPVRQREAAAAGVRCFQSKHSSRSHTASNCIQSLWWLNFAAAHQVTVQPLKLQWGKKNTSWRKTEPCLGHNMLDSLDYGEYQEIAGSLNGWAAYGCLFVFIPSNVQEYNTLYKVSTFK